MKRGVTEDWNNSQNIHKIFIKTLGKFSFISDHLNFFCGSYSFISLNFVTKNRPNIFPKLLIIVIDVRHFKVRVILLFSNTFFFLFIFSLQSYRKIFLFIYLNLPDFTCQNF